MRSSKKSASAKKPAKRRTSSASKAKKSKSVRKAGNGTAVAKTPAEIARHVERGNAHLLKAWKIMYESALESGKLNHPH